MRKRRRANKHVFMIKYNKEITCIKKKQRTKMIARITSCYEIK